MLIDGLYKVTDNRPHFRRDFGNGSFKQRSRNFQRPFSWKPSNARCLYDSDYKGTH